MNPVEQEENRAFRELVQAFERFRQAHESAVMARMREAMEDGQLYVAPPCPISPPGNAADATAGCRYLASNLNSRRMAVQKYRQDRFPGEGQRSVRYRLEKLEQWVADPRRTTGR